MALTSEQLSEQYQKKTDKEMILTRPDMYIGSIENIDDEMYIMCEDKIIKKRIKYIPGLVKLFDEGIVNTRDHVVRCNEKIKEGDSNIIPVSCISITIKDDVITMTNDGNGIDIEIHPEHKIYIPEMILTQPKTSTNYGDKKKKTGGKNGYGASLIFTWSEWCMIETVDHNRELIYTQEFKNNLDIIGKPSIKKCKKKPYTKISFKPDYKRLKINGLSEDVINLLKRRVYDISAITDKKIKVKYNDELIQTKHFQQYIDLYVGNKSETSRVYECPNNDWEYAVCLSDEYKHISFVNGIHTSVGGKHVDYIMDQIIKKLRVIINNKKKADVKPATIREQLTLFLNCTIEDPSFDSQTKDTLKNDKSTFGSTCIVSDDFIKKLINLKVDGISIIDRACALTQVKENKVANKTTETSKSKTLHGISKLIDANYAGTSKSMECTIILCEGDSAKAGIVSGLTTDDRNYYGVYPMKGKLLNVRDESNKKIISNSEISDIQKIIGLSFGKKYDEESIKKCLRYGKILLMTDQDLDGSHIKGLCLNLFETQWESIVKMKNMIGFMNTPILKATKNNESLSFYNEGEFELWKQSNDSSKWKIKYFKGLGTSREKDFKQYFKSKNFVNFTHSGDNSKDSLDKIFNKKRADDRKEWLNNHDKTKYIDTSKNELSIENFIDYEMRNYSINDCERSIPNIMDGFKTSLRKIAFACFKRNIYKSSQELKVAQLSGYVSEHSAYHHGEESLNKAIIGMAQDFVGSNNINLLYPSGQFGTRLKGGKDFASSRYIFTYINDITRYLFIESDENILTYLEDDGNKVEPIYYAPIIPMILVNGSKGIGTGHSTDIPCFNVKQIIQYLLNKLSDISNEGNDIDLYYKNFKGSISKIEDKKYLIKGVYKRISDNAIQVTELPIGTWTDNFKSSLETLYETSKKSNILKDYSETCTSRNINFVLTFYPTVLDKLMQDVDQYGCDGIEKLLKLTTTVSLTNMKAFDANRKLCLFESPQDIVDNYYPVRLKMYEDRKQYLLKLHENTMIILSNKAKYIMECLNGTIDLRKKKKDDIKKMLREKEYDVIDNDEDYRYLIKMPMDSVSEENVEKTLNELENKKKEIEMLKNKSNKDLWIEELHTLQTQYEIFQNYKEDNDDENVITKKVKKNKKNKSDKIKALT